MSIYDLIFGCLHKRTSFPLTRRTNGKRGKQYVACLECGKEFDYDWKEMRIVAPAKEAAPPVTASA